jgi:tripartite-type tricarboxylate transporter receptor subunit TctC
MGSFLGVPALAQLGRKTARMVIGFSAGGAGDALARALAEDIKALYPSGIIVDNRPGASGRLAIEAVRTAEPDGNTLLYSPSSLLTILPHAVRSGTFRPVSLLQPVAAVSKQDFAIAVTARSGFKSVSELLSAARSDPSLATFGTAGAGTPQHLIGHLLSTESRVRLTHVPYKGGAAALQDTVAGHTPICITAISQQVLAFVAEGRLRILGVAGERRSSLLPTVATLSEQGFKSAVVDDWSGVFAPLRTPSVVIEQIAHRLNEVTASSSYAAVLAQNGQEALSGGPAMFSSRLKQDDERWAPVIKAAGFTIDS